MNVLVTGASGFVGRHLVDFLFKKGANISSLGRSDAIHTSNFNLSYPWNSEEIFSVVEKVQPDYFFHLIGNSNIKNYNDSLEVNFSLAKILLKAIDHFDMKAKTKCLVFGSAAEYGLIEDDDLPISESFECNPFSNYGKSKLLQTNYALDWAKKGGMIKVIRPFSIFGNSIPPYLAVGNFAYQIIELIDKGLNKGIITTGNINVRRDFIDVKDVIEICWRLVNVEKSNGGVFNVCSGQAILLKTIIEYMSQIAGIELQYEINKSLLRNYDPLIHYGSNSKLIQIIGDYNFIPWEESVKNIMDVK